MLVGTSANSQPSGKWRRNLGVRCKSIQRGAFLGDISARHPFSKMHHVILVNLASIYNQDIKIRSNRPRGWPPDKPDWRMLLLPRPHNRATRLRSAYLHLELPQCAGVEWSHVESNDGRCQGCGRKYPRLHMGYENRTSRDPPAHSPSGGDRLEWAANYTKLSDAPVCRDATRGRVPA